MKNLYIFVSQALIALVISTSVSSQNLTITPGQSPQQLVDALVGAGVNSANPTGQLTALSNGLFVNNGVTGFTLTSGILLSTGEVTNIPNSSASFHNSINLGLSGDQDLTAIVTPQITYDVSKIEFDFSAANDSVSFYFVFGSEEYNEYVNSNFNDVFAFIINGPGYAPNTNVALLQGTTTPISINTVNNGQSNGTSIGPCMNCTYYVDNVGTSAVGMSLDGSTIAIEIKFPVWPCSIYHFKIAIGDVGDGIYDSAVMMQENSFVACPIMQALRQNSPIRDTLSICVGGTATISAPEGVSYIWSTGETTRSIVIAQPGTYSFTITDPLQPSCLAVSNDITVIQQGAIQTPLIVQNGNMLTAPALNPTPGITYQWSLDGIEILGATQSAYQVPVNGCYTLTIYEGTCESTSNMICVTNTSLYEMADQSIQIYPHPVNNVSIVETPFESGTTSTLLLLDVTGRQVRPASVQTGNLLTLEKGELDSGIYFLELTNNSYEGRIIKKIVLQ